MSFFLLKITKHHCLLHTYLKQTLKKSDVQQNSVIFLCVSIQHCICSLQYILHSVIVTDISKNMPPTVPSVLVCQVGLAREYTEN